MHYHQIQEDIITQHKQVRHVRVIEAVRGAKLKGMETYKEYPAEGDPNPNAIDVENADDVDPEIIPSALSNGGMFGSLGVNGETNNDDIQQALEDESQKQLESSSCWDYFKCC
jgi:hypothetical protein